MAPEAGPLTHPAPIPTSSHSRFTGNAQCAAQCGPTCCSRRYCARDLRATTSSGRVRPVLVGASLARVSRETACPADTDVCLEPVLADGASTALPRPLMNARRRAAELMAPSPHDSRGTSVTIRSLEFGSAGVVGLQKKTRTSPGVRGQRMVDDGTLLRPIHVTLLRIACCGRRATLTRDMHSVRNVVDNRKEGRDGSHTSSLCDRKPAIGSPLAQLCVAAGQRHIVGSRADRRDSELSTIACGQGCGQTRSRLWTSMWTTLWKKPTVHVSRAHCGELDVRRQACADLGSSHTHTGAPGLGAGPLGAIRAPWPPTRSLFPAPPQRRRRAVSCWSGRPDRRCRFVKPRPARIPRRSHASGGRQCGGGSRPSGLTGRCRPPSASSPQGPPRHP